MKKPNKSRQQPPRRKPLRKPLHKPAKGYMQFTPADDDALRRRALSADEFEEHQRLREIDYEDDAINQRFVELERKINKLFMEEMKERDRQESRPA